MKFTALTLFPELFDSFFGCSIIKRAIAAEKIICEAINIRDFAQGRHQVTDDKPYGGGSGMIMKPEPLTAALDHVKVHHPGACTVLLTPQGRPFDQTLAREFSREPGLIFICGRYEGIDERFALNHADLEVSLGDYVLTGGELGAMVIIDAVARLVPGVLGGDRAADIESFAGGVLEYPQYTRPPVYEDQPVPPTLLSGNHRKIDKWRAEAALIRTVLKRPDLLENRSFSDAERLMLKTWTDRFEHLLAI
ncbi:MAG: tRNA (guanosine(37)-N1)-methyltransferase TrmD [Deltaproteobacteria bacterium]|nr:MAG: tRNA (guanosine(37)-N1)-methyltransferase TrmD [Deltaproteobacteria bacterium]